MTSRGCATIAGITGPATRTTASKAFIEQLQQYRSKDGSPDALVAFSGGRDSSYGLHLIKKEFGLSPITFTYDWAWLRTWARNVARMCGKLGIQNILVSADIKQKRENIRKNSPHGSGGRPWESSRCSWPETSISSAVEHHQAPDGNAAGSLVRQPPGKHRFQGRVLRGTA